ncbi:hypothetical protein Pan216_19450 [Planctomycetes bacterium Pan216]|uniref:Uncharacterized protein n=1 Tax=Kolteria novifilia TaxID=2527975 RepID=A0A518B272_9BACT|nr:hypothetical protein Pan216_19450 [Planctomycetes bacterium Pan216]
MKSSTTRMGMAGALLAAVVVLVVAEGSRSAPEPALSRFADVLRVGDSVEIKDADSSYLIVQAADNIAVGYTVKKIGVDFIYFESFDGTSSLVIPVYSIKAIAKQLTL